MKKVLILTLDKETADKAFNLMTDNIHKNNLVRISRPFISTKRGNLYKVAEYNTSTMCGTSADKTYIDNRLPIKVLTEVTARVTHDLFNIIPIEDIKDIKIEWEDGNGFKG